MRRFIFSVRWSQPALLFAMALLCCAANGAIVFGPPENSPDATTELKGISRELNSRNYSAAARRLDVLLSARTEQLASLTENALTSVTAWLDQLPPPQRKALAAEYAKLFATPARQALESLASAHAASPEELYAIARRYPMTASAGAALMQAGDRALQLGDFAATQSFYELALKQGAALGETRAHKLEALQKITAGQTLSPPADLEETGAGKSTKPDHNRLTFTGPLPFGAPWFGHSSKLGDAKFFPAAFGDRILISSWKGVSMLRENGQALWNSPNATAPGGFAMEHAASHGRGALFAPAVLTDVFGEPAVIVVRQPTPRGDSQFVLRALRASDGSTLWVTPPDNGRNEFSYAGLPAISGRYVYCLAVQKTIVSGGNLLLCALDLSTGQSLWQATLGSVSEQGDLRFGGKFARGQAMNLASFADLSEPAISSDLVIVSPNCGSLIAVGRFDGKIRWVYSYRHADAANAEKSGHWMGRGEGEKALQTRYRCTPVICGEMVLTMPQDVPAIFEVDRASGKYLWDSDLYGGFAIAGSSGHVAVISGEALSGIDAIKQRLIWKYEPPHGTTITGPAVVIEQTVIAPTASGFIQLNAADGKEKPVYDVPSLRRMLATDAGKAAVNEIGIPKAFGVPDRR
jgi:outer membrane protein assembly factor BamB